MLTYHEAQAKGQPLLAKYGLHDWQISLENCHNEAMYGACVGCLGYCDLKNKVIRIDNGVGRQFRQTLLHEIAHALRGPGGHDMEWINIADKLGCTFAHLRPYVTL